MENNKVNAKKAVMIGWGFAGTAACVDLWDRHPSLL